MHFIPSSKLFNVDLTKQQKSLLIFVIALSIVTAAFELFALSLIMPIFSNFQSSFSGTHIKFEENFSFDWFFKEFTTISLTILCLSALALASVLRGGLTALVVLVSQRIAHEISLEIFKNVLSQELNWHQQNTSNKQFAAVITKVNLLVKQKLTPFIDMVSSGLILFLVSAYLVFLQPTTFLIAAGYLISVYWIINTLTTSRLKKASNELNDSNDKLVSIARDGLNSVRELKFYNHQDIFDHAFEREDLKYRRSSTFIILLSSVPRYVVETAAFIFIILILTLLPLNDQRLFNLLGYVVIFILASQRMLPSIQKIFAGFVLMRGSQDLNRDITELLKLSDWTKDPERGRLSFDNSLTFEGVNFEYPVPNSKKIYGSKGLSFQIQKNQKCLILGGTGSGKSTLLDLLSAVSLPSCGSYLVDGQKIDETNMVSLRQDIAYVPQKLFMSECSILENITFKADISHVDRKKLEEAVEISHLAEFVKSLPCGLLSEVGEAGKNLSGGQLQRIGIARAIYSRRQILILDEATNALDEETEARVLENILAMAGVTVIMVTHKPVLVEKFDLSLELMRGGVKVRSKC